MLAEMGLHKVGEPSMELGVYDCYDVVEAPPVGSLRRVPQAFAQLLLALRPY